MKPKTNIMYLSATCILALTVMVFLPLNHTSGFTLAGNTPGELGAQMAPHAWVMNAAFVFLASGAVIAGWPYFEGFILHRIVLAVFGISLTLMAFFNQAPASPDIPLNFQEDGLHSYFACTAGLSFVILSMATGFILEKQPERLFAIGAGVSVLFLSILVSEAAGAAGIWQRLMFIISFGWMIYCFKAREL